MSVRRVGLLVSGGDCPGLNAVLRAVLKAGAGELGLEIVGIRDGYKGLLTPVMAGCLEPGAMRGLLPLGGTILGTSRTDPYHCRGADGEAVNRSAELFANVASLGLDGVIVVGGDGSLRVARDLHAQGLPVVGVPKTIDNDIGHTDLTFGFDSAVTTAQEALDKLHTTAESHHRVMVVEVMGRDVGWIALAAGISGGADAILIPEIPFSLLPVVQKIDERDRAGKLFSIVVVSEGAAPLGGAAEYVDKGARRLGGMGETVAASLARLTGHEVRAIVLGHLQRGGSPSSFDRLLATRFGSAAAHLVAHGGFGRMVALRRSSIVDVPIASAVARLKHVPLDGQLLRTARDIGITLGEP